MICAYNIGALVLQDYIRAISGKVIWRGDGIHFI
jgi:hypothetical protein